MIVYQTTLSMLEYHSTVTMCLLLMELIGKQNSVPENYFNDLHGPVQPKLALDDMLGSRTIPLSHPSKLNGAATAKP